MMISGTLEQFLDTGWYMECTLYYDGYLYRYEQTENEMESCFLCKQVERCKR